MEKRESIWKRDFGEDLRKKMVYGVVTYVMFFGGFPLNYIPTKEQTKEQEQSQLEEKVNNNTIEGKIMEIGGNYNELKR